MIDLSKQVDLFVKDVDKTIKRIVPSIRTKVAESVINKTPLDTGEARGNWQSSIGAPITTHTDRLDTEAGLAPTSGTGSSLREAEEVARKSIKKDFFIVNNAGHIVPLEYGLSTQAPAGMVRITVADFPAIVSEAATEKEEWFL